MNSISLVRTNYGEKQTVGELFVMNDEAEILFHCFTLELPWKDNQKQLSCIPEGRYKLAKRNSPKYGDHLHILNVPNRELILIHQANYVSQLLGCIAVGDGLSDINGDGLIDVTSSINTKNKILEYITGDSEIVIGSKHG